MKHLSLISLFVVLALGIHSKSFAQPFSGFTLETLDESYVPLTQATVMSSENWDEYTGWDDPEFIVPVGFDFDFAGTTVSYLIQMDQGTTFFGSDEVYYNYYFNAILYLLGEVDLADLGLTGVESLGSSFIQWQTTGEPGQRVFTLEYVNAGLFEEVFSDGATETYSVLNFQFRLFESSGVIEIHFGPSLLSEYGFATLQAEPIAGWHGLVPSYESIYNGGSFILTNINTELMYDDIDAPYDGIPFEGFPADGRLFRYTPVIEGCDIETACNYDVMVNYSVPEECIFPEVAGTDCNGECLVDADANGSCDELMGCTEGMACNYNPEATDDDGSCIIPETGYGCDGECLSDVDGDGVCDANEIAGCEEPGACNYAESPTDLEPCVYAEEYYDCEGECLMDADGDGVCDELEVAGCTDFDACNFEWWATDDDGSCMDGLPLTLVGDTLVAVGDTMVISVEGPVEDYFGQFNSGCWQHIDHLEISDTLFVGVILDGFESCDLTYIEWGGYYDSFCGSNTLTITLDPNPTAVSELAALLSVYPNPVSSLLTVEIPEVWSSGVDARMVNVMGQTVWTQRLSPGTQILDVSDLPNGMHLLMYKDRAHRVLIQH